MDRTDRLGTGVAIVGHVALFGALSFGLAASIPPRPVPPPAMEVEFVDTVALEAVAAPSTEAMTQAEAPETGTPEDAMPQPAPIPEPLPLAPAPEPVAAPPVPAPPKQPEPRPLEPKPVIRAAPKPALPKPAPAKPTPAKKVAAKPQKVAPAKQTPARSPSAKATTKTAPTKTATAQASGDGAKTAARAPRLGKNFLAGLSDPLPGKADKPQAPAISANAMAGIVAAIKRQVQPCANKQVNPGPGANRISIRLQIRLNRDGSLATAPKVVSTSGVDDENSRYAKRVADLAIAAYTGCAPMRGLPEELYKTAKGGWNNVAINYKLPG